MKELDQKIIELMDLFDDEQVTTADKIDRPQQALEKEAIDDFVKRNPMAGGGMLVQPGFGGVRQGYKQERKSKNYPNLVKEYDKIISKGLENENLKDVKSFQQFLREKNVNPKSFSEWKRKGNTSIKTSLIDARLSLARNLVDKANNGNKVVYIADIAPKIGLSWFGTNTLFNKNELALDSPKTKAIRVFNNFMTRESVPAKEMFNMVSQMADEVGITRSSFSNIMKDYPDYEDARRLFKNLATPSSKKWILNNPGATFADVIDKVEGRQFRENLLGNIRSGKSSAEHKIMLYAARHERQGGNKIEFINRAGLDKNGNILDYRDIEFIYKEDPNNPKTWSKWDYDRILTEGAQSDIFKDIYKAEADLNSMLSRVVKDPRTGKDISFGKLMTDTYSTEGGHTFGFRRTPYEIDHMDSVLNDPFKNVRILPRRINQILGQVKNQANIATTPGTGMKMKNIVKYIGKNKEQILNTIDPNFANIQSIDDLINSELATSNRVFETLKKNPELKGKVFKSSKELFNEITSMGDRAGPIDINFRTQNLNQLDIRKPVGTDGPRLGALDIPSMFKKLSPATRKLVGFGGGTILPEILFYQLDKANRMSKGVTEKEAAAGALESGTLGAYTDKAYMEELKKVAESMNIDSGAFDSAYNLNVLSKSFEQNSKNVDSQIATALENQDVKTAEELRKNFNKYVARIKPEAERLRNDIEERVTGGSPLTMAMGRGNVTDEQYSKPFYDMQDVAMEKLKKEKQKVFDTQKRQVDTAAGNIGEDFYQAFDSLTQGAKNLLKGRIIPFGPDRLRPLESDREREARYLKEMDPRELFLYNKARGYTYDDPITEADLINLQMEQPGLFAGGGIAKMAGDRSGAMLTSMNPDSQGLSGLLKRGIKT